MEPNEGTKKLFDQFADVYREKYMSVDAYSDGLDLFCELLSSPEAHILDLACGPGNISRYLLDRNPAYKILGLDLAPRMIDIAREVNPEAEFRIMDLRKLSELDGEYAGIICGFGLPYLSKEEANELFHAAYEKLRNGGILYLSTMEGRYSDSGWSGPSSGGPDRMMMYYHEKDRLEQLLREAGFRIVYAKRQEETSGDPVATNDLILLARANP